MVLDDDTWLKQKPKDLKEANLLAKTTPQYVVTPVAAARFLEVKMRAAGTHLAGAYPTPNEGQGRPSQKLWSV